MDKDTEFSKLYKEHYESIRKYVKAMLGEGFLADDIYRKLFWRRGGNMIFSEYIPIKLAG